MLSTTNKVHSALLLRDIFDNEDINNLLPGKCDIVRLLLGNQVVAHGNQWPIWTPWGQFGGFNIVIL